MIQIHNRSTYENENQPYQTTSTVFHQDSSALLRPVWASSDEKRARETRRSALCNPANHLIHPVCFIGRHWLLLLLILWPALIRTPGLFNWCLDAAQYGHAWPEIDYWLFQTYARTGFWIESRVVGMAIRESKSS